MSRLTARLVLGSVTVIYAVQLTGCAGWSTAPGPVPQALAKAEGHKVRVTLDDSSRVPLVQARLAADTLEGLTIKGADTTLSRIPQARIVKLEVHKARPAATVALVVGLAAAATAVAGTVAVSQMDCMPWPCN